MLDKLVYVCAYLCVSVCMHVCMYVKLGDEGWWEQVL